MRLLLVNYEYPPLGGGGGVAMRDVAVELAKRHEVHVLTSAAADLSPEEVVDGVRLFRAPVWGRKARSHASFLSMITFWPIGTRFGRKLIARYDYDVINTWFAVPSGPTGAHLAKASGRPNVLTLAGGDIYDPSKWYTPDKNPVLAQVVKWVLNASTATCAVSTDLAGRAKAIYGFQRPIEVISLGAYPSSIEAVPRATLGLDDDAVYMVTLGRLVRRKNLARLLDAMAAAGNPKLHLLVLGDGPEKDNLASQAASLGLGDRVHFKGFVSETDKHRYLQAADIFTLPSLHEAFGIVYIEGMLAGLPVIASKPGGQEDYLTDGETGFLVDREDTAALTEAIRKLAGDPRAAEADGRQGPRGGAGLFAENHGGEIRGAVRTAGTGRIAARTARAMPDFLFVPLQLLAYLIIMPWLALLPAGLLLWLGRGALQPDLLRGGRPLGALCGLREPDVSSHSLLGRMQHPGRFCC